MDGHVEPREAVAPFFYYPYRRWFDAIWKGVGRNQLAVSEWVVDVLCGFWSACARKILSFARFIDAYTGPFASNMLLLCSARIRGKQATDLQPLQQCEQKEEGEPGFADPPHQQEKLFCGELQLRLAIPSCLDSITLVGGVINAACLTLSFSEQEASQIELCVVEAVVNAIKHAYSGCSGHVVEIRVATQADRLVLQVCDDGLAMTREIPTTLDFDPTDIAQVPEGGMGLFLMHSLMDEVSYVSSHGTNVLTMTRRMST